VEPEAQQSDEEAAAEHALADAPPHPAAERHPEQGRDEGDEGGARNAEREGAAAGQGDASATVETVKESPSAWIRSSLDSPSAPR